MEQTYRVEAFIMPVNKLNDNEMDDVKFANKLKTNDDNNIEKKISVVSLIKDFESIVNKNEEINLPVFGEHSSPSKKFVKKKETIVTVASVTPVTSSVQVDIVDNLKNNNKEKEDDVKKIQADIYKIENDNVINNNYNIKQIEKCDDKEIKENNIIEIQENKYNEESFDTVDAINEPIYDVPIPWHLRRPIFTNEFINDKCDKFIAPIIKASSLLSIDEHGETFIDDDDDVDDGDDGDNICCHGLKNGCTVIKQKPEQVTEDIFKTNWLKRIEELRERETIINNKELILAEREKLLFKKEKELRILERLLKEKIRNAELFMSHCKLIENESINNNIKNKKYDTLKVEIKNDNNNDKIIIKKDNTKSLTSLGSDNNSLKNIKNPTNSKSSLISTTTTTTTTTNPAPAAPSTSTATSVKSIPVSTTTTTTTVSSSPKKKLSTTELNIPLRNQTSMYHSQNSFRKKRKQKICYDDLDSTLSADIGDSSFVVTSKKFDPELFKKPMAFMRSSSERRPKNYLERPLSNIFEDEKVLKRISDNILVSQDESTIFQDYGLIDNHNNKSTAYLDLDNGSLNKNNKYNKKLLCNNKTTLLNEKSNEWLQKKRQAYNSITNQKMPIEDFDTTPQIHSNKENNTNDFKNDICQKIKTLKGIKKFGIFR